MQLIALTEITCDGRAIKAGDSFTTSPAMGEALVKAGAAKPAKKS